MVVGAIKTKRAAAALPGVGLGLRRELLAPLLKGFLSPLFVECAPENWMGVGGALGEAFEEVAARYPIFCHGLSLSLGSPEELNLPLLKEIKSFLDRWQIEIYSEHLSFTRCGNAHLYELLPLPFCEEAVLHVSKRIREAQEFLERPIAIENISYYLLMDPQMDEGTFLRSVVEEADCLLLLDVNNIAVNRFNHHYDPIAFLDKLPLERVLYLHVAGHEEIDETFRLDTHAAPILPEVYQLLDAVLQRVGPLPILLERDGSFPPPEELQSECDAIRRIAEDAWTTILS